MRYFLIFIVLILGIQFIKIDCQADIATDLQKEIVAPPKIKAILKRSCYDCHSNHAVMPWYSDVAPISWFVRSHINEGREHLNFSTFNTLSKEKQKDAFDKIGDSVVIRMPLPSYLWVHKDASLSSKDRQILQEWSHNEHNNL